MPKATTQLPTESELEILTVIWKRGPSTVREVFTLIHSERDVGLSTILKLMQIMTDKGSLIRDDTVRPQIFRPAKSQHHTQGRMVRNLLDRAFEGSPGNMVLQALSSKKTTPDELRQVRELLDQLEADQP